MTNGVALKSMFAFAFGFPSPAPRVATINQTLNQTLNQTTPMRHVALAVNDPSSSYEKAVRLHDHRRSGALPATSNRRTAWPPTRSDIQENKQTDKQANRQPKKGFGRPRLHLKQQYGARQPTHTLAILGDTERLKCVHFCWESTRVRVKHLAGGFSKRLLGHIDQ